ncbi:Threonine dehydratase protein [Salinisphaera shabanensis E1L3A]|jgi:threonine dehydratase|uniref:Threonine dehydratase protein n=1 Tax=Salinisphaera shabanensis E1L3A TaxID=1033802 RepID=F7Q8G9_9GAMM|nr:beta-hydroxyaspartate dehydratase BhcB [Salinisphaera shabanensis]ERJ18425.1 Threonine dehydratase protein [Salinisphaera shabanensis E1L3A]
MQLPDYDDVCRAHERIAPWIHRTPILTSATFDAMTGARLFFKCENFQKTGAFKSRGAVNAVFGLEEADAQRGVATHSSGNHGMALARAAACRGIECTVVMPETAPRAKVDAVRGYGGQVVFCAPRNTARQQTLDEIVAASGANVVPPYDDARVIAGQGTCAKELLEDVEDLDIVIAPIGGGGLISGTALSCRALSPHTQVLAGEPANADDAYRSVKAGERLVEDAPDTIADGLKASLGELNWGIVIRDVDDILLASEEAIIETMRLIWQRMKIIVEPSCAVPLAAILHHPERFADQRVGVILTGGNVDLERLPWL